MQVTLPRKRLEAIERDHLAGSPHWPGRGFARLGVVPEELDEKSFVQREKRGHASLRAVGERNIRAIPPGAEVRV
jgi:hypothetical protein